MKKDQAQRLRELYQHFKTVTEEKTTKVVSVTSGKGGVGKSNFALNFALGLSEEGQKVVLIDLDIGMANLEILLGMNPKHHLMEMVYERKTIWDVMEKGPAGLELISGGSSFNEILDLSDQDTDYLFSELSKLQGYADLILFDTGAGLSKESQRCHLAADEIILVTTPEPTAMTDAYSVIKILHHQDVNLSIRLVVNRVANSKDGAAVANRIRMVTEKFLGKELEILGFIPNDSFVVQSVLEQTPFLLNYPKSQAAKWIRDIVSIYLHVDGKNEKNTGIKGFIQRISHLVKK
ncbi:MinD/ParA family protein [Neobacillus cucumis]|uniref:Cobyrinic acid a,c-diamide synthase n=1 Tax=Neobacillus cucumis TaxID=1740721 RepID=A0A2N5H7H0_9BACI|nr:MinD/ParA family protein [Neobacillus cucumis]PLS01471.1 cobyrinic acid a,c-diamide synthase [Neobacillus cucumis]